MINPIIDAIDKEHIIKRDPASFPTFGPGDTIKVFFKIQEGNKFRVQAFEGVVLKVKGSGIRETFTVRRVASGNMSVERIFPANSPLIESIEVVKRGIVRRAKLYYLRDRTGKAARIKENLKKVKS
ncbi:MAG: 50S ribosomal protein L19 [Nitrospinae bacterium]|nr:50S ribosomal protein L19 [Nitrospinota bacterium]